VFEEKSCLLPHDGSEEVREDGTVTPKNSVSLNCSRHAVADD
jgi:hypothetical protein